MRPVRRTLFRLAETLGKSVREVERDIDSAELSEWMAYWKISPPFDPWLAMGIVCSTVHNLMCKKKAKPVNFIPFKSPLPRRDKMKPGAVKGIVRGVLSNLARVRGWDGYGGDDRNRDEGGDGRIQEGHGQGR